MNNRRRTTTIIKQKCVCNKEAEIELMKDKVIEMHKVLLGNGQLGMLQEFNQFKGAINTFKWLGAGGGIAGIASLIIMLVQRVL